MDNSKTLRSTYRKQLIKLHALTVMFILLLEILVYTVLVLSKVQEFSVYDKFLRFKIIVPSSINIISHIIVRRKVKKTEYSHKQKNRSIIGAALITALVVAFFHREYIITLCAFVFPIFMSAMFNDKKLLNKTFTQSVFILTLISIVLITEEELNSALAARLIIAYAFNTLALLSSQISIKFSKSSFNLIDNQEKENSRLQYEATHDHMTGLINHDSFFDELQNAIDEYHSAGKIFTLSVIDIDDFKAINDTYGHDNGDKVLITLANMLKKRCSSSDLVSRFGGEEFTIVFSGKNISASNAIMQRILKEFEKTKHDFTNKSITLSCGLCQYGGTLTKEDIFAKADKALYNAKHNGKNQVAMD